MNVWLAEKSGAGSTEQYGIFSRPERAKKVCQDAADDYLGPQNTPALNWQGVGGHTSASYHHPAAGMFLFQITRFTVDEVLV
jgi:hypothetical protein